MLTQFRLVCSATRDTNVHTPTRGNSQHRTPKSIATFAAPEDIAPEHTDHQPYNQTATFHTLQLMTPTPSPFTPGHTYVIRIHEQA